MIEAEEIDRDVVGYLARERQKELLRFLTCGSVDDGKSTLIGRMLHDADMVYDDQLATLKKDSAKKGSAGGAVDYSLLVDGLLSEREQGITIDVAYRYFATPRRKFIIADTPGHEQYTRNMATGASTADLAIILIDARYGVLPQTRRHSFIAHLLGIKRIVVAINKMDLLGFDEAVFTRIRKDYAAFAGELGLQGVHYIPLSAREGDNVVTKSASTPYYDGPALLEHLETVPIPRAESHGALRFPVQYVSRPNLDFRGFAGTVASGVVKPGDQVMSLPSRRTTTVSRVVTHDGDLGEAGPPLAVTLTLADEIDASRGDMLVHPSALPHVGRSIEAMVVWMGERPMQPGGAYLIKHTTRTVAAEVRAIHERVDITTLERHDARSLGLNDIGRATFSTARPLLFDAYAQNRQTGAFIVIDRLTNGTVGAGMILGPGDEEAGSEQAGDGRVSSAERAARLGQRAAVVVLTGASAARQEELAYGLERRLWDEGTTACVLGPREVGSVKLCASLGLVVIATTDEGSDLAHFKGAIGPEALLAVVCDRDGEATSVEGIVHELARRKLAF